MRPQLTLAELEPLFWPHVTKSGPVCREELGECWVWSGDHVMSGYGRLKRIYAHRIGYALQVGPIPAGLSVLHRCDNPPCVRGSHLFTGTARDNAMDMVDKGRNRYIPHPGESNGAHKLTEDEVRDIRSLHSRGWKGTQLAASFGMSTAMISNIVRGTHWKNIS